jgi:hypothetical protein
MQNLSDPRFLYNADDFFHFRNWLNLSLNDVTWQGKFRQEFEDFWEIFFLQGASFSQVMFRFSYCLTLVKAGPIWSWFIWLRKKFIIYSFLEKELSKEAELNLSEICLTLRDFFIDKVPEIEDLLNDFFQLSHRMDKKAQQTFRDLKEKVHLNLKSLNNDEIDQLSSLEVTLFPDWKQLIFKMRKDFLSPQTDLKQINKTDLWKKQKKFLREVFWLALAFLAIVVLVTYFNKRYEGYLLEKITSFEPQFFSASNTLKFQDETKQKVAAQIDLNPEDIRELESIEATSDLIELDEARFTPESEVVLTSIDDIPQTFESAQLQRSTYEEERQGGFRDVRYGSRKVYRVLMTSVDSTSMGKKINKILDKFKAEPIGNVLPGTVVPGGLYYNLYVPQDSLKDFLSEVMDESPANLYENNTRTSVPAGMNRVFIWVKQI